MSDSVAFDKTVSLVRDRLNLNTVRQKVGSSNLANLNTPNYRTKEVSFDKALRESLERDVLQMVKTTSEHLEGEDPVAEMRDPKVVEGGAVDLDDEIMKLTQNSVEYQFFVTMLSKKYSILKSVVDGVQ